MHNFYLQHGFQVVFIKGDGEFKPLDGMMSKLYGAPKLNLSSANEHVLEIERNLGHQGTSSCGGLQSTGERTSSSCACQCGVVCD
jgi:hypothetical protein